MPQRVPIISKTNNLCTKKLIVAMYKLSLRSYGIKLCKQQTFPSKYGNFIKATFNKHIVESKIKLLIDLHILIQKLHHN